MATADRTTAAPIHSNGIEKLEPGDPPAKWREAHPEWSGGHYEVAIVGVPGLRLRVTKLAKGGKGGAKVFRWYVTSIGRVVTLGHFSAKPRPGFLTFADAHKALEKLKGAHAAGKLDEAVAELHALRPRPIKAAVIPAGELTVKEFSETFMETIRRRRERPEVVEAILKNDIIPALGSRTLASITPTDVEKVIVGVVDGVGRVAAKSGRKLGAAPTRAGAVLQVMNQFFRTAQSKNLAASNPASTLDRTDMGISDRKCDRFLSPAEIEQFWKALDVPQGTTPTVRAALRLLLLTGVRSGELLQAEWKEIEWDADPKKWAKGQTAPAPTWTIPVEHQKLTKKQKAKGAKPFRVPLAPTAIAILRKLQAFAESLGSKYVLASFHARPDPVTGQTADAPLTDKALNHSMRHLFQGKAPLLRFDPAQDRPTPHDLRRTMRTHLVMTLRVPPHVAEKALNHSLGRIFSTYDTHDYLDDRRDAMLRWNAYVERLATGKGAEIVAISKAVQS
jgi:integrase